MRHLRNIVDARGPLVAVALVVALFVWSVAARLRFLLASPYPLGLDGYYYAVQVRSLLETGHLHYPANPLTFWWLAPFAWAAGPIQGIKLGAAIGMSAATFPAYLLGRQLTGQRAAAVVAAAVVATSAHSFYLSTEFLKQGLGLTLALCFFAALTAALTRPHPGHAALAVGLFILVALTHKLAVGISLMVALPTLALAAWRHGTWSRWLALGFATAAVLLSGIAIMLWPTRILGSEGLQLLTGACRGDAKWSLPTRVLEGGIPLYFRHEALLTGLATVCVAILFAFRAREAASGHRLPPTGVGLMLVAGVLSLPWLNVEDAQGLGARLRLAAFIPLSACAALVFARVFVAVPTPLRQVGAGALALLLCLMPAWPREGTIVVNAVRAEMGRLLADEVPPGATVITTDRQLAFMTTWYARAVGMTSVPQKLEPANTYRLIMTWEPEMRRALAAREGLAPAIRARALPPGASASIYLLPEAGFEELLKELPPETQRRWREWSTR